MVAVSVVVPTRFSNTTFLTEALDSIRAQNIDVEILIGIDRDGVVPEGFSERFGVTICRGSENSQAGALNAGLVSARGEYVAFLEDDDKWLPEFLVTALGLKTQFVSSSQLEVDEKGVVLRIKDFPTPSGWVAKRDAFTRLGPWMNMLHLDNFMLGRIGEEGLERWHLVEATAPIEEALAQSARPLLHVLMTAGKPKPKLHRHPNPVPLVVRRVHAGSGMWSVLHDPAQQKKSNKEFDSLMQRFGGVPW
jgi:glycosyltransferase involved in cell wall biosynthesis